jgi:hypothetical protein
MQNPFGSEIKKEDQGVLYCEEPSELLGSEKLQRWINFE